MLDKQNLFWGIVGVPSSDGKAIEEKVVYGNTRAEVEAWGNSDRKTCEKCWTITSAEVVRVFSFGWVVVEVDIDGKKEQVQLALDNEVSL